MSLNKTNEIKENLERQFQDLLPDANAPESLKKEVFQTLDTLALVGDIADLFTARLVETEASMIDLVLDESDVEDEDMEKPNEISIEEPEQSDGYE